MSDDSPFGDFQAEQGQQQQQASSPYGSAEQDEQTQGGEEQEDQPIALPPPGDSDNVFEGESAAPSEDAFGLSSPPPASSETADPFATVDGGSSSNAGAFDSFSGGQQPEVKEEEAAALQLWEKERSVVLRDRAGKAEADKQALLKAAKEEVQKFYADREATLGKNQKTNRADEKNYRSDMKTTFESGARWEKVNKLVSTAPRPNEKAGTSRVERFRKLLIQLKAEKKQ